MAGRRGAASENPALAAVHARQRTLADIVASLGRQLLGSDGALYPGAGLYPGAAVFPAGPRTGDQLITKLTRLTVCPVIVLDALDEAGEHQQLLAQLLIPLAQARRADGTPACRLSIGTRPWREFARLLELAREVGEVIDLDRIPVEQRRQDEADYVTSLLELLPGYATAAYSGGRRAFADAVAATLVAEQTLSAAAGVPVTDEAGVRWGEFLVAALYTHTISLHSPGQLSDPVAAAQRGSAFPRTLPEVLELDLATRPPSIWRRLVLTALAHARGTGMPRSVLPTIAAGIAGRESAPSVEQVSQELATVRFYLRTSAESNGSTLYRLFHQGLADYLRGGHSAGPAQVAGRVLDGLLATVPIGDGVRRWDLVEPYLLRHAIQHAAEPNRVDELLTDPEFLVYAETTTLIPLLDHADSKPARLTAAVYRVSTGGHPQRSAQQRRDVLAVDAARYGATALLDGLAPTRGASRSRWRPRWATGGQVSTALRATLTGHTAWVTAGMSRCGSGIWPPAAPSVTRSPATPMRWRRWPAPSWTADRSPSPAAGMTQQNRQQKQRRHLSVAGIRRTARRSFQVMVDLPHRLPPPLRHLPRSLRCHPRIVLLLNDLGF